jgi:hypothetical protein
VVHLLRGTYIFAFAPVTGVFDRSAANSLFFLAVSAGAVSWSLGFIVLTGERLGADSKRLLSDSAGKTRAATTARLAEAVPDTEVRQQLHKILESDMFRRSAQMERFLTIVVERSFLGHPEDLKEYALGRDVFHRGEDYDPRADSIVRVEAQRLRRKLREYYESQGREDRVIIDLPAGSYVPSFRYLQQDSIDEVKIRARGESA